MSTPKYYVTTPIYYVNDVPHIGHAYTTLAADMLARFKRLDGFDVLFLTGTDEHGQKVEKSAEKAGLSPLAFCDQVSERFSALTERMSFSHDQFIRTTEQRHTEACQDLWQRLVDKGALYKGSYSGWYAVRDEAFYAEKELIKQSDGSFMAPTGASVDWVEEPSYFFRLSAYQDQLLALYADQPDFVLPESRLNEVRRFVEGGLDDLSVSRTSFNWGVPVPSDPDHVMYVWIDALTNYLTAVGYPDQSSKDYASFWPADVHIVGKDILRFHAVYWPAFLMAADLPLPKRVFAHGWWTNEGEKISKSLGNVIDPFALVDEFGLDQVRYFLLREVPFGNDGDFSHLAFVNRVNADLANNLGNLAQRSLSMIYKNCHGSIPEPGIFLPDDTDLLTGVDTLIDRIRPLIDRQAFHKALELVWFECSKANQYFAGQEPWALKKTDPDRMNTVLYITAEVIRQIAIIALAVIPAGASKLLSQLGIDQADFRELGPKGRLKPGIKIDKPQGVFPQISLNDTKEDLPL